MLIFPLEKAGEAMAAYAELVSDAPDELATCAVMLTAPPEQFVPPNLHGKPVLGFMTVWAGDVEEGERVVAPLKAVGPAVDLVGPIPYRALQAMIDPMSQPGFRNYWRGLHLTGLDGDVVDTYLRFPTEGLFPLSFLILFQHGGAVSSVPDDATAFSHRDAKFMLHPIGCWEAPDDDERHIGWVREVTDAFEPFRTGGVYLNFMPDSGEEVVRSGFAAGKYDRLAAIKAKYDPDNMFRFNQNIAPAPAGAAA
jgi:FAD/FMN-containing dehydrogenase